MADDGDISQAANAVQRALADLVDALEDDDDAESADTRLLHSLSRLRAAANSTAGEVLSWIPGHIEFGEDTAYRDQDIIVHTVSWILAVKDMDRWMREGAERARRLDSPDDELTQPNDLLGELFYRENSWPDEAAYEAMGISNERVQQTTTYLTTRDEPSEDDLSEVRAVADGTGQEIEEIQEDGLGWVPPAAGTRAAGPDVDERREAVETALREETHLLVSGGEYDAVAAADVSLLRALCALRASLPDASSRLSAFRWLPALDMLDPDRLPDESDPLVVQHRTWIFAVDDAQEFVRSGSRRLGRDTGDVGDTGDVEDTGNVEDTGDVEDTGNVEEAGDAEVEEVLDDLCQAEVQWPDWAAYADMGLRLELESFGAYRLDRAAPRP